MYLLLVFFFTLNPVITYDITTAIFLGVKVLKIYSDENDTNAYIFTFSSMTNAAAAAKALRTAKIECRILRLDAQKNRHGCGWGVLVKGNIADAQEVLLRQRIVYTDLIQEN